MTFNFQSFDVPRQLPFSVKAIVMAQNVFFLIGVIFFVIGTIFTLVFASSINFKALGFGKDLKKTSGEITVIMPTASRENKVTVYVFQYDYVVNDKTFGGQSFQPGHGDLKPGDTVPVEYEAANPALSRIEGMRMSEFPFWVFFLLLIFPAIGLIFLIIGIRKGLYNLRLLTYGVLTKGKVTGKEATNTTINKQRVYKVFFEFKTQDGKMITSSIKTHQTQEVEDEPEEMLVYDSNKPEDAVLLDSLGTAVRKFFS